MVTALVVMAMLIVGVPSAHADDHTVAAGDTLWTIAAAYGVSVDELMELNSIDDPRALRIGQSLKLPEPPYEGATLQHIVQPGETLISISALYDVTPDAVLRLNELSDANRIQVASVLEIPDPATVIDTGIDDDGYMIVDVEYIVESGDTLTGIAQEHNVEPGAIVRASGLQSANIIQVGQVLLVPERVLVSQQDRLALYFETWAEANELDPNMLKALGWQESRWDPAAISYAGAVGVTQIMPGTRDYIANELIGEPDLSREDAEENIRMGARYMAYLLELTDGNIEMALGSYYQGFTSVTNNGYRADTVRYIEGVLGFQPRFESGELPN